MNQPQEAGLFQLGKLRIKEADSLLQRTHQQGKLHIQDSNKGTLTSGVRAISWFPVEMGLQIPQSSLATPRVGWLNNHKDMGDTFEQRVAVDQGWAWRCAAVIPSIHAAVLWKRCTCHQHKKYLLKYGKNISHSLS